MPDSSGADSATSTKRIARRHSNPGWRPRTPVIDHLYLGGDNARRITFEPDPDIMTIENRAGIEGVAAWHD
jgi:hypothetical protein